MVWSGVTTFFPFYNYPNPGSTDTANACLLKVFQLAYNGPTGPSGPTGSSGIQGIQGIPGTSVLSGISTATNTYEIYLGSNTPVTYAPNPQIWRSVEYNLQLSDRFPHPVLNGKQLYITYNNLSGTTDLRIGLNNTDSDGTSILQFQILAADLANSVEYVLASYLLFRTPGYTTALKPIMFITPKRTTVEYYVDFNTLTSANIGTTYCINDRNPGTANYTAHGATTNVENTIFTYSGSGAATGTGTVTKVVSSSQLIQGNWYVIKVAGNINWTSIGASSATLGTLFMKNATVATGTIIGCCLDTVELDLTGMILKARACAAVQWGPADYILSYATQETYLVTQPSVDFETPYAARRQLASNPFQMNWFNVFGGNNQGWNPYPRSEFLLKFTI